MKRSTDGDMGSLELLLDTMCNTFGCLIFVAILLSILTQQIGHSIVKDMDPVKVIRDIREATVKIKELETERMHLEQQLATNADPVDSLPTENLMAEHHKALRDYEQATTQFDEANEIAIEARAERDDTRQTKAELTLELANLRTGETVAQQKFGVPEERMLAPRSSNMHFAFREGKLYSITKFPGNQGLELSQVNAEVMIVQTDGGLAQVIKVTLKPNSGTTVVLDQPLPQTILRSLNGVPTDGMINFHVGKDSFPHFIKVRDALLKRQDRPPYNWMPTDTSQAMLFQSGGGGAEGGTSSQRDDRGF